MYLLADSAVILLRAKEAVKKHYGRATIGLTFVWLVQVIGEWADDLRVSSGTAQPVKG